MQAVQSSASMQRSESGQRSVVQRTYEIGDLEVECPVRLQQRLSRRLLHQPRERHHRASVAAAAAAREV
jgi:hypothetical protein